MISATALLVLFRILVAHILADFFLQRYKWIVDKRTGVRSPYLYYHVVIVGVLTYLLLADWTHWQLPLFITVTHFLIDWWKSTCTNGTRYFVLDQIFHIAMLIIGWGFYIGLGSAETTELLRALDNTFVWVVLSSYLLVLRPYGFLIGKATQSWQEELEELPTTLAGLPKAGTWIGYMERIIILTFVLMGQYGAIGFLIAAKSVFRFSGKSDTEDIRKQAEYILIGTLMSFLLAIVTGIAAGFVLRF
jgi:hypothetical protein